MKYKFEIPLIKVAGIALNDRVDLISILVPIEMVANVISTISYVFFINSPIFSPCFPGSKGLSNGGSLDSFQTDFFILSGKKEGL